MNDLYDVGTIDHVEIRFDHSGDGADWYLDYVFISLNDHANAPIGRFTYGDWLETATTIKLDNKV